jgi:hypothetical protein
MGSWWAASLAGTTDATCPAASRSLVRKVACGNSRPPFLTEALVTSCAPKPHSEPSAAPPGGRVVLTLYEWWNAAHLESWAGGDAGYEPAQLNEPM